MRNVYSWARTAGVSIGGISICLLVLSPGMALATPITYTETATITGSLAGQTFSGDVITLTGSGDTANITHITVPNVVYSELLGVSFSIAGVGSGTFVNTTEVVDNNGNSTAGFSDVTANRAILFTGDSAFSNYDLSTSIGPISGTPGGFNPGFGFSTTAGTLAINDFSNLTFSAVAAAVPGPIVGAGLPGMLSVLFGGGLVYWQRRRRSAA